MAQRNDDHDPRAICSAPCPSWCEGEPGHPYDEECHDRRQPGRVTDLTREHLGVLGTVWSEVGKFGVGLPVQAVTVRLWQREQGSLTDAASFTREAPQVLLEEERGLKEECYGLAWLPVDQAEALAELLAVGAQACRDIEAGREPVLPAAARTEVA